jgi:hypothetical protein
MLPSLAGMNPSPEPDAAFYEHHFSKLIDIATSELHIPGDEAVTLVHDVLVASICRLQTADIESWLRGALQSAALRLTEVRS